MNRETMPPLPSPLLPWGEERENSQESVEGACEIPQFIAFGELGTGSEGAGIYTQPAEPVAEPGRGDGGVPQPVRQRSQGVHELFGGYAGGPGLREDLADVGQKLDGQ